MIQFLAPLSLFALAALLAPLLIHLLSRKAGKRVKVGSIKFLLAAESRHLKSLKLSELALLLLRCALLAVLVLLLAQPQWLSSAPQPTSQELILVAPDLLQAPAAGFLQELDSLTRAGNELRLLVSGFPRWHSSRVQNEHENYWSLMRELETR
ncbi:BatA domain-containing protein, partial [candidate division KSB1 bacterium]|nr:BatA domain-containing protein [candidate division KSB1 bacterium]